MTVHLSRRALLLFAIVVTALVLPASANAMLYGMESNGELANSDRTPAHQTVALDLMKDQGANAVRVNFGWIELANNCGGQTVAALKDHLNPCYRWDVLDSLVALASARGQQVVLSTMRVPTWVLGSTNQANIGATAAQRTKVFDNYAAFLAAAGTRYKAGSPYGTITYWTIWNEPNSSDFWSPMASKTIQAAKPAFYANVYAQQYAQMYGKAAVALRGANPAAQIAPGPTGPNSASKPKPYIMALQKWLPAYLPKANPRKYINAWAHNPYTNKNAPLDTKSFLDANAIGMAQLPRLFQLLDSKPITKGLKVWATEFGYETPPETRSGLPTVSFTLQAQWMAEAFDRLSRTGRVTIGIWYGLTDPAQLGDWQSGTILNNGTKKLSYTMYQRMISVPTGSVKKGTIVKAWGRSSVDPKGGILVYRKLNAGNCGTKGAWKPVPSQKRAADGSITGAIKTSTKLTQFAIWDPTGGVNGTYGLCRTVTGK